MPEAVPLPSLPAQKGGTAVKKLWKWLALPAALLLCTACGTPYDPNRHQYTPEERSAHYEEYPYDQLPNACGFVIPDDRLLESTVLASDLIVTGTIADAGTTQEVSLLEGIDDGSTAIVTSYQIDVREVLYGSYDGEQLTLRFYWPFQTKPYQGDELFLFLAVGPDYCLPTTASNYSVFVINPPDDRLFALSNKEVLTAFDGRKPKSLEAEIDGIVEGFQSAAEYPYSTGAVALSALTEDSPLYEEYRDIYRDNPYYPEYAEIFE